MCAIEIGNVPVARELLLSSTQVFVLKFIMTHCHINYFLQEQLKSGKGSVGDNAIHLAARKGDNDLVKLFIEAGTKVDTQNVSGFGNRNSVLIGLDFRKRARLAYILLVVEEMRISSGHFILQEQTPQ